MANEINSLSAESASATQKIDTILKDVISSVAKINKVIDNNNVIAIESNEKLDGTVKIFEISCHQCLATDSKIRYQYKNIVIFTRIW